MLCVSIRMCAWQVISGLAEKRAAVEKELNTFGSAPKGQKDVYKECSKFHKAYAVALEVASCAAALWCFIAQFQDLHRLSAVDQSDTVVHISLLAESRGDQPHPQDLQQPGGPHGSGEAAATGPALSAHERQVGEYVWVSQAQHVQMHVLH